MDGYELNEYGQELADDFFIEYSEKSCYCPHVQAPCGYCLHDGNPINLEENPEAWVSIRQKGLDLL